MSTLTAILNEVSALKHAQKVNLVAVSKLQSIDKIRQLAQQGQVHFGENYVQELLPKIQRLNDLKLHWHFIGKLQRNKVKQLIGQVSLIHSVDSIELAAEINKRAQTLGLTQKVLWQLNLAQELTKAGNSEDSVDSDFKQLTEFKSLEVTGLMTMPPLTENRETVRPYFQRLREIRDQLQKHHPNCKELSMGTSSDWQVAVEEGATLIRLGTVLFGARPQ